MSRRKPEIIEVDTQQLDDVVRRAEAREHLRDDRELAVVRAVDADLRRRDHPRQVAGAEADGGGVGETLLEVGVRDEVDRAAADSSPWPQLRDRIEAALAERPLQASELALFEARVIDRYRVRRLPDAP